MTVTDTVVVGPLLTRSAPRWRRHEVKDNGYAEAEILEELEQMTEGGSWVDWRDNRDVGS